MAKKATKKKSNQGLIIGAGVIVAGAALAYMNQAKAAKIQVDPGGSTVVPTKGSSGTSISPGVAPKLPVPVADTSDGLYRDTSKSHVFVDSWDGETIWGKIDTTRWASMAVYDNIAKVNNNSYLGKLTGKKHSQSLWDWIEVGVMVDGVVRKFWIDKTQVKLMTEKERDIYLKGGGGQLLSDFQLDAIRRYLKK